MLRFLSISFLIQYLPNVYKNFMEYLSIIFFQYQNICNPIMVLRSGTAVYKKYDFLYHKFVFKLHFPVRVKKATLPSIGEFWSWYKIFPQSLKLGVVQEKPGAAGVKSQGGADVCGVKIYMWIKKFPAIWVFNCFLKHRCRFSILWYQCFSYIIQWHA